MSELRLVFVAGPRDGQSLSFPGPRVRVGRSRDNDIVLPDQDDPRASGHHAELLLEEGDWWVVDLGSRNGTYLNGRRVERERLRPGDRLGFGDAAVLMRRPRLAHPGGLLVALGLLLLAAALATALWVGRRGEPSFEAAAARAARSVYLVVIERDGRAETGVGSAFAVRPDGLLATNAHVAAELLRQGVVPPGADGRALARVTDGEGAGRAIVAARLHPGYEPGTFRNDVALLVLEPGAAVVPLPLADAAALAGLRRGTPLAAFGFPAGNSDPARPRARLSQDVLGDLRARRYLEVGLGITPGTSGSPIFLRDGTVVGLVVGGDFARARDTGLLQPTGSGVNWGLTVAPLLELLETFP